METKQSQQLEIATPVFGLVRNDSEKGQTLIELLLAIGLTAIILPAILTGLVTSRSGRAQQNQRLEAVGLLKEAQEAVRNVREKDWNTFAVNGTFYATPSGSMWTLTPCSPPCPTINGFTRSVVISDVKRDPITGAIVLTGGTLDPSTKKIVTTVSWSTPITSLVTSTSYIARLDNLSYTETLGLATPPKDFDLATTKTGITVTKTIDGEFVLSSGTQRSDWCKPATPSALTSFDLPKNGVANAIYATAGINKGDPDIVYAGTGENASGVSFQKVSVSDANPPVPSGAATFDGYKTNGVFGDSGYAYLATDNNSKEIVIMSLTQYSDPPNNTKYLEVGHIDLPGSGNGNSIYVVSNLNLAYVTGYTPAGGTSKFYIYDISNKASPVLKNSGGLTLAGKGNKVIVINTYAYVATSSTSKQLQIIDVSNPSSPSIVGNLPSGLNDKGGRDVFVNPTATRAYVVTAASAANNEFFIIDTTNKSSPQRVSGTSSFETNGMDPKGVTVVTNNKAIVVGTGGVEYQVIDISNESALPSTTCGELNIDTGVNGVAGVLQADGDAYSYIITGDATAELKIIPGGDGGGGGYVTSGTFESQTIPIPIPATNTSFNRFQVTASRPNDTDIYFQVAVAQIVNNSCGAFNYVGPDGTSSTFFTTSVTGSPQTFGYAIPSSINPGRCFRYKAYLSSSSPLQTPVFYQIDVNYSP